MPPLVRSGYKFASSIKLARLFAPTIKSSFCEKSARKTGAINIYPVYCGCAFMAPFVGVFIRPFLYLCLYVCVCFCVFPSLRSHPTGRRYGSPLAYTGTISAFYVALVGDYLFKEKKAKPRHLSFSGTHKLISFWKSSRSDG